MHRARTTRCCSSIALIVIALLGGATRFSADGGLGLFPLRAYWTLSLNNALAARPAFTDSRAYFPIEGDRLAAYDLGEGTLRWIATVRTKSDPVVGDGLVFIVEPDALTALREMDGTLAWQLPFTDALAVPLVWDAGWLVAASTSGSIFAFRASDGQLIWRRDAGVRVHARPSFGGDRLYVPLDDARLLSLQVNDGIVVWERRLGGPPDETLALDDRLYVGSNDNFLYCLRTRDGTNEWRWRTGADVVGLPVVDEQHVYFVSFDNVLRALDRRTGTQRWKRPLGLRPTRGVVHAADAVFVSGMSAKVSAFYVKDGAPAGEITAPGELAAAPHITSDATGLPMVVLAGRDIVKGTIVAAHIRAIEPATEQLSPLPNPVLVPPTLMPPTPATPAATP